MKSTDQVGITFANVVTGRGVLNGIVNVQLAAYTFVSTDDGKVDPAPEIVSRLRMDETCARQLHEALGDVLALIDKAKIAGVVGVGNGHDIEAATEGKPN